MAKFIKLTHSNGDVHLVNISGVELCCPDPLGVAMNFISGVSKVYTESEAEVEAKINIANNTIFSDIR